MGIIIAGGCQSSSPSFSSTSCTARALAMQDPSCLSCASDKCESALSSAQSACADYIACVCQCADGGACPPCSMSTSCLNAYMALANCADTNAGCCDVCCRDAG
ncbi:MAG TPA: hypothetical protein VF765_35160 [Polyangiaceae bacterium]